MMKKCRFRLKKEILFWFLLLALIPILILSALNYFYQKDRFQLQAEQQLSLVLNQKIQELETTLNHISKELQLLSKVPITRQALMNAQAVYQQLGKLAFSRQGDSGDYYDFFEQVIKENEFYDLFLINLEGDVLFSVAREADFASNLKTGPYAQSNLAQVFHSSIAFLDIAYSDFEFYTPSREYAAFAAVPIFANQKLLGVIAVQINKTNIDALFQGTYGIGESGEFVAANLNENKQIVPTIPLKHRSHAYIEQTPFDSNPNFPIYKAVMGQKSQGMVQDYRGETVIAAWGYLPILRWGIVVKTDLDEILVPIYELRFYSIVLLFFVSLGIIFAVINLAKRIVKPVEQLNEGVQKFTAGDLSSRVDVETDNEIGVLANNFNGMAQSLMESQQMIRNYADQLESKVEQRTSQLEHAKAKLEAANHEMKEFMRLSDEYILSSTADTKGNIIQVSEAFAQMCGYRKEELIGRNQNILRHPETDATVFKSLWKSIAAGSIWQGEFKNLRKNATAFWVSVSIFPILDDFGEIREFTAIYQDISDKKKVEKLSYNDHLTKIANRHYMETVFNEELSRCERYGRIFCVLMLDLDYFKQVNDQFGHNVGDDVLVTISQLLKQSVRKSDYIGRWGGEEFIILAPEISLNEGVELAEKIRQAVEEHKFEQVEQMTCSLGVAQYLTGDTQDLVVKRADDALYRSKAEGRNRVSQDFNVIQSKNP
ncbi:diguanylate cyclase [Thiomicrorhabdus indica]|uniref:diguanylate cyclase n=1 Tax=Thiomicrorhabdus indica TaxID=2267253 RepID=UPI002AA70D93|nr:diguanylate cyclase [Thiomicrorhabdus indica]